jgi:hypothetical protein
MRTNKNDEMGDEIGNPFETPDLDIPEISDTTYTADNIIRLREIELEHKKEKNRFIQWCVGAVVGGAVAFACQQYFIHQDKMHAWSKAQVEMEVSKRKQRLEEIKEFSKHQQEFADKIMDLLGEGKASNYAKVCRLATYMSTVPTSPEVRAGWKEFLGDMTVLLKLAEKKQVDAANASKVDSLSVVKGNGLSNSEKLELEELHVLKAHKPVLSADRMERLQELEAKALEIPVIQVPDDLYGNISRRAHRQQMRAQSQLVPMLDMINLPEAQGDDT